MTLRVLLADDHQIVRQGVRVLLERAAFTIVAEATDGREAVALAQTTKPDVVILDVAMPLLNGIDAGREILRAVPSAAIVLLTMHTEEHVVASALRSGIGAFVVKTAAAEDLVRAIQEAVRGQVFLSAPVSHVVVNGFLAGGQPALQPLAPRERQVLQLVAEGKTSKEIAALLGLSIKTAETYRAHLMDKLDIHDTAGLVRYAIREGLICA